MPIPAMTKRQRLKAVLAGQPVDHPPVGFWRHWPGDDQREGSLVNITLEFQRQYDLDFIKLPVSSAYTVNDWGIKHEYQGKLSGDRTFLEPVVKNTEDWKRIQPLNVTRGVFGWHLHVIEQLLGKKDVDTPLIVTIFNPLSVAFYLSGEETGLVHMRSFPDKFETVLKAITQTLADFVLQSIQAGADGIFLSSRHASYEAMSETEYNRFGRPGDLEVLKAAASGWFNVLHLHGQHPMLVQLADYPVQALNWHDRSSPISLNEASQLFSGALMGGVEQNRLLQFGTPEEVAAQVKDAITQMQGKRLIIAPGCTYPISVPHANLVAMRKAVETV